MVNYVTGNLFQVKTGIIAHGVNCRGAFGSGVAGQIRKLYPFVRRAYLNKYDSEGWKLGEVQLVYATDDLTIANCATQYDFGTDKVQADYGAIGEVFQKLIAYCEEHDLPLALPRIGAGLAGGDWNVINNILQQAAQEKDVDITVYSL